MTAPTAHLDAARRLGIPPSEVADVETSPAGTIITTTDGARYIDVPTSSPDGEGKTGLMFLVAPTESYGGSFPVFALADDGETVETAIIAAATEVTSAAEPVTEGKAELTDKAIALGITVRKSWTAERIAQAIAEHEG